MALEQKHHGLRTTGMMVGFLLALVGPITLFGQRKHSRDFIFDAAVAIPWATLIGLAGSLLVLWACWKLPKEATGGVALGVILLLITAAGIIVATFRIDWNSADPLIGISMLGQLGAITILGLSAHQCAKKPHR